jgi:putative membrane protein
MLVLQNQKEFGSRMNGMAGGMSLWLGLLFWLIIILIIVWLVVKFSSTGRSDQRAPPRNEKALEILERRFARGEIDSNEFEEKRKQLTT